MVYLGTSITAGSRASCDSENNERNGGSNGHNDSRNRSNDDGNESSGDEEREGQIRVGKDYQSSIPSWIPLEQRKPEQCPERALLVWSPCPSIANTKRK